VVWKIYFIFPFSWEFQSIPTDFHSYLSAWRRAAAGSWRMQLMRVIFFTSLALLLRPWGKNLNQGESNGNMVFIIFYRYFEVPKWVIVPQKYASINMFLVDSTGNPFCLNG
jgi:hypothetical protein